MPIPDSAKVQSLREYARHRDCNPNAVSRAVKEGRLTSACVARDPDGKLLGIFDFAVADREWAENTSHDHRIRAMGEEGEDPSAEEGMKKAEASAIETVWKAKLAELKFKQQAAELVPARDVANKLADVFTQCKVRLLALPSRARQALPHLTASDIGVLENLIRDALEDLAAESVKAAPAETEE